MKLKPLFLTICLIVLAAGEAAALTQNAQLVVNELKVFQVYKLKRVAVGDPAIADVTVLSERELMLIAKKAGATSLIIWDEAGQRSFNITVIGKDLEKIAQRIRGLLISSDIRGVRVKTEEDNIYVMGEVLNQRELDKVKDALAPFANVVNLVNLKERQPLVEI
ncbi:MAG: pilus assembly protein N-terminal domain-containing protein, partial [Candidatus Omnitrophica bacterium]|nr:pilus assembly protein N-terminal domain-containing protein [Candidatus Omnitrophota bacterium]